MKAKFPQPPINTKVVGKSPAGETKTLIQLSAVEEHVSDGTYQSFVRVLVHHPTFNLIDTFYFDIEDDYKVYRNFLQTDEKTMELLTLYLMAIQDSYDLNKFTIEVAKKYQSDFGFTELRMVDNQRGK